MEISGKRVKSENNRTIFNGFCHFYNLNAII